MSKVSGICGRCHAYYAGQHCPKCGEVPLLHAGTGLIHDHETTASLPTWMGFPSAQTDEPGKRSHVVVPSKKAWREAVKRNAHRMEDAS